MDLTLYTEEYFKSAHKLENYEGKCASLHGHTWKVCLWIKGSKDKCDKAGILWDFGNLKQITENLDHKYLNDILKYNPTCENLTIYIYEILKENRPDLSFKVRVYENILEKQSWCESGDF